jgi:hypothetical protein
MDPFVKKSKKKARKTGAEAKAAVQTNVNPPAEKIILLGKRNSSWITNPRGRQDSPR